MAQTEPAPANPAQGRVVARFAPAAQRERLSAAAHEGRLRRVGEVDLLEAAKLPALARASLLLFVGGGAGFLALELVARDMRHGSAAGDRSTRCATHHPRRGESGRLRADDRGA